MRAPDAGGRRRFVGVLCGVEDGAVTLEVDGQRVALPLEQMDRARLVPDL
jgi:ribosome maturation factor RimP